MYCFFEIFESFKAGPYIGCTDAGSRDLRPIRQIVNKENKRVEPKQKQVGTKGATSPNPSKNMKEEVPSTNTTRKKQHNSYIGAELC